MLLTFFGLPMMLSAQTLENEWSFNESGGTTATDSVSGANISLEGACSLGGGVLTLPGGGGNYAQLPNGILSSYTNSITIETWLTDAAGQEWSRAWSFGNNNGDYIDLIPTSGSANNIGNNGGEVTGFWTEFNHNGVRDAVSFGAVPTGVEEDITMVLDVPHQTARIYLNGGQVATATVPFAPSALGNTVNNWLGQDEYGDSVFQGAFDEMRIWSGAVSQRYLSASAAAGPGVIINNLTPTSASLTAPATLAVAATQPAIFNVTLPQTASASLLATADATNWISSNPAVLTVDSNGMVTGVAPGTATVSAAVGGVRATSGTITVIPQLLEHRWSFNESGGATAIDSVSGANITLQGACSLGGGVLTLPGGAGNYAQFPNGIVASNYSITIETWLTDDAGQGWSRAWSFGGPSGASLAGQFIRDNYIDLIPTAGGSGGLWSEFHSVVGGLDDTMDVINSSHVPMPIGTEQYVVLTYSAPQQTCVMYSNGVPISVGTGISISPASLGFTYNNFLGLDQWNDSPFNGTFDEMRIWDGVLSPVYMLVSAAAGPDVVVTNTAPQTLTVSAGANLLGSQTEQAAVTGSFIQAPGPINVITAATNWTSSDTGILTVNSSGLITGVSGGTATVSATVGGVTATSSAITVATTAPTIIEGITNLTAVVGDTAVFNAQALGGELNYQWSFDGSPVQGATNAVLTLADVALTQGGTYSLMITNGSGSTNISAVLTVVPPILQHEWSFNESGGTTAYDSIENSNITLLGGSSLGGGVLTLPGGAGNYAQFPNGILSTYSNSITIETWLTDSGGITWARAWSFGGGTSGPNNNFIDNNYIDLIPTAGNAHGINGGLWTEFNHNGTNTDADASAPLPTGTEEYVAVTYEVWDQTARLYLNGEQVAAATNVIWTPADMGFTYNNFLGLDQWNDPTFNGTIDEMRIWNGAITPLYGLVSADAGPGVVITNTTPAAINITAATNMIWGQTQQASVEGNFAQISNVPLTALATNWMSSNPNVLTVNSNGFITAVGLGNASISATVAGVSGSGGITVTNSAPVITQQPEASETFLQGATLSATVGNVGTPPFVYRWYYNGGAVPISTSANPALTIPDVQPGNTGTYTVLVSNLDGSVLSSNLSVTVVAPTVYEQAVLQYGPLAYWPLDESSGTIAYDVIGGHNGTYEGEYALGQTGPPNSFFGGSTAAGFDGFSGYVDIPEGPFNLTNAVTTVAWVQMLDSGVFGGVVGHGDSSWRMSVNGNGQPGANDGDAQGDATDPLVSPGIVDGNWHMILYTYTGVPNVANNGSLYVDGTLVANNTIATAPPGDNLDVWIAGSPDYPTTRLLPADVANAAIFNQAFTAAQVKGLYHGTYVAGPQTITIAKSGSNVVLSWQTGTLLESTNLMGPWSTNSAAAAPYSVPATNATRFFKLLVTP